MDIVVWLQSLGLARYEAAFRDNEIDRVLRLSGAGMDKSLFATRYSPFATHYLPPQLFPRPIVYAQRTNQEQKNADRPQNTIPAQIVRMPCRIGFLVDHPDHQYQAADPAQDEQSIGCQNFHMLIRQWFPFEVNTDGQKNNQTSKQNRRPPARRPKSSSTGRLRQGLSVSRRPSSALPGPAPVAPFAAS